MRVFINNSFHGHHPVGASAVVVAEDKHTAAELLAAELNKIGLVQPVPVEAMVEVSRDAAAVIILHDGDY